MKKLLAVFILGTLVACGTSTSDDNANNEEIKTAKLQIKEQPKIEISEINNIIYETELKTKGSNKHLYIEKLDHPKQIEDETYQNLIFYTAEIGEEEASVQTELSVTMTELENVEDLRFENLEIEGVSVVIAIHPIDSEQNEIYALAQAEDKLVEVIFEDETRIKSLAGQGKGYKFIKDQYFQTLNHKKGHTFTSWIFDKDQLLFNVYYQDSYTKDEEKIETGEYFASRWLEFEDYFLDFPYYTFTEEDKERVQKGYLADLPHPLDIPIEEVLEGYTIYDAGYYDGGPYYETRDGMLFYDEATDLHSVAFISGDRIKNDYELEDILGEPDFSGRNDMYPDELYSSYQFEDYMLLLIYNDNNDLIRVELYSFKNR